MSLQKKRKWFLLCILVTIAFVLLYKNLLPVTIGGENRSKATTEKDMELAKQSIISSLQDIDKHSDDYLIYDCMASSGYCGGWNDRITGVINTLMISLLIDKKFRLIINTPCDTKAFFAPNKVNWTVAADILSSKHVSKIKFLDKDIFQLNIKNLACHFNSRVNFFRSNWEITDVFRVTPYIKKKIPWICNIHHADIYKIIFEILFKPTKSVLDPISRLSLDKSKKLVCAHVRMGRNPLDKNHTFGGEYRFPFNRTTVLFEFLKKFDTDSNYMYIASDSPMLKKKINKTFPNRFVDIPGEIIHADLDRERKDACAAYAKSLSEWWILTMCDVLILTQSGFGVMAAYLRDNNKPLYCINTDKIEIVPCTRYDVLEHYAYEMHIPLYIPISKRNNVTQDYCPAGKLQLNKNLPEPIQNLVKGRTIKFIESYK